MKKNLLPRTAVDCCSNPEGLGSRVSVTAIRALFSAMVFSWSASWTPGVAYQVWGTTNMAVPMALVETTTNLAFTNYGPAEFVRVRAINDQAIPSTWGKTVYSKK